MFPPANADGRSFRALFEHPDQWTKTRTRIDGVGYADHWLSSQFTDAELRSWLPLLPKWHLKLGLEVGALKPWGVTADKAFAADRLKWDRFIADGARIDSIAMDEPFAFSRKNLRQSVAFAAGQTARFVALVRRTYPAISVGDIEPYPGIPADELVDFLDEVQSQLRQMNVRGLDFFRLDVDWMHFQPGDRIGQGGWQGVRDLQGQFARRGLAFSLIYWAANFPSLNRDGEATEQTWETAIMQQGADYQATGGVPDEMVIESWVNTPSLAIPETAPDTFTRSVLDFTSRYAPGRAAGR
jgi:hypothetical protein